MAAEEEPECEGCISDESSFYGDDEQKGELGQAAKRHGKRKYEHPFPLPPYKSLKRSSPEPITRRYKFPHESVEKPKIHKKQVSSSETIKIDHFKNNPAAWQQDESIYDFLRRLPVDDPASAKMGHWLWVGSPTIPRAHANRKRAEDTEAFAESAHHVIEKFEAERRKVEGDNPGKAAATITKKMGPYRDQLEDDLLCLAIQTGTTCGKWMLFPKPAELKEVWAIVAAATSEGKLGHTSKVGTRSPGNDSTLICVYTYNFSDFDDVRRVLKQLVELGLCYADGKPIFYKCDAYTYLGIKSDNVYKLKASLWSSTDVLNDDKKALAKGPVARLKEKEKENMLSDDVRVNDGRW